MATYLELNGLRTGTGVDDLVKKIAVAICVKANAIAKEATPPAEKRAWARQALANPADQVWIILNYIVAEYSAVDLTAIIGATDAQVQDAVNAAVDTLLGV